MLTLTLTLTLTLPLPYPYRFGQGDTMELNGIKTVYYPMLSTPQPVPCGAPFCWARTLLPSTCPYAPGFDTISLPRVLHAPPRPSLLLLARAPFPPAATPHSF